MGTPGHEMRPGCEHEQMAQKQLMAPSGEMVEPTKKECQAEKWYGFMSRKDQYLTFVFTLSSFPT